jgi:transcriptional regulator with XRE-family HTH domain
MYLLWLTVYHGGSMPIGDEIRIAREAMNVSQVEMARRVGIPRSMLRRVEQGENITLDTLERIVAHLPNLQALHLGAIKLLPQNDLHDALNQHVASGTALLDAITRLAEQLTGFVSSNDRLVRTLEQSGALGPPPSFEPLVFPVEPPLPERLAAQFRELDRSIDAGTPLVSEPQNDE